MVLELAAGVVALVSVAVGTGVSIWHNHNQTNFHTPINATAGTMPFAKSKPGKSGEVKGSEHTSGARPSSLETHEKGQTRKQQVNRDKKRQKPNWKSHK